MFQGDRQRCSLGHSAPLWVFREEIETRGVLGLAMAQAFTSFGACTKLRLVWLWDRVYPSHRLLGIEGTCDPVRGQARTCFAVCVFTAVNFLLFLAVFCGFQPALTSTERNAVCMKEAIMNLPLGRWGLCSASELLSVLFMSMFTISF